MFRRHLLAVGLIASLLLAAVSGPAHAQAPAQPPSPAQAITLIDAVTRALQQNLQLQVAAYEVTIARQVLEQARAGKSGQASLVTSYTRTNEKSTTIIVSGTTVTIPTPPESYVARISMQYPLYTGGRLEAQIALAEASLRGAEATLERTRQTIVLATRQAYYQLLLARAQEGTTQRLLAQAEGNLSAALARVQAGTAPRFDALQADVSVAAARQQVVRSQTAVALARQSLAALLNLPLDASLEPQETLRVVPVRADLQSLLDQALRARPELVELQARVAAAAAARDVAASGGRPTVAVAAGPDLIGASAGSLSFGWSVNLALTLNVFDGGITAARVKETEARLEQLRASEAQLRQSIALEVRQGWLSLRAAEAELEASTRGVEQAQEALRLANVRYGAGVTTNLEVLSQQSALSQAESNHTLALFNYNLAVAQIERATGTPAR
ncbi:MAG: TolC family protein [Armatimonadetes bacterium]|nr:TolC family protein [Armatimonadota bacterium]